MDLLIPKSVCGTNFLFRLVKDYFAQNRLTGNRYEQILNEPVLYFSYCNWQGCGRFTRPTPSSTWSGFTWCNLRSAEEAAFTRLVHLLFESSFRFSRHILITKRIWIIVLHIDSDGTQELKRWVCVVPSFTWCMRQCKAVQCSTIRRARESIGEWGLLEMMFLEMQT